MKNMCLTIYRLYRFFFKPTIVVNIDIKIVMKISPGIYCEICMKIVHSKRILSLILS